MTTTKAYKIKYYLLSIFLFRVVFCGIFHPIPTQVINHNSEISIDFNKYVLSENLSIDYKSNSNFDIRVSSDSLYINSPGYAPGLSILNININNEFITFDVT